MSYICVYLPYFAFAALVIGGLHYHNNWVITFGILAIFIYNVKPELKILARQNVFKNCTVNILPRKDVEE